MVKKQADTQMVKQHAGSRGGQAGRQIGRLTSRQRAGRLTSLSTEALTELKANSKCCALTTGVTDTEASVDSIISSRHVSLAT